MFKIKNRLFILFGILFMFVIYGCENPTNETTTNDIATTTADTTTTEDNTSSDTSPISDFVELATGDTYSYTIVSTSVMGSLTETYTFKVAKDATHYAYSIIDPEEQSTTTLIYTEDNLYMITEDIDDEIKDVYIYPAEFDPGFEMDLSYLTSFDDDDFIFDATETNVMVGDVSTTCYEYTFMSISYKYYVDSHDVIVKIEYEDESGTYTEEIQNFKTTNIDTAIFTVPTEDDGYTIYDFSEFPY